METPSLKELQIEIRQLRTMIKDTMRTHELLFKKLIKRQQDELKACREAFLLNVERDEELRTTIAESNDPWDGC